MDVKRARGVGRHFTSAAACRIMVASPVPGTGELGIMRRIVRAIRVLALATAAIAIVIGVGFEAGAAPAAQSDAELGAARRAVLDGDIEEGMRALGLLADQYPDSGEVALWHGHALKRGGRAAAATREYLRTLELQPLNAGAMVALGDLQAAANNLTQALAYYQSAIEVAPGAPIGYRRAAAVEVQMYLHHDAIDHLQRYLALAPDDAVATGVLGVEQYMDEDIDAAIVTLERALAMDPGRPGTLFGLGMALADRPDQQDRALELLARAIEADPDNAMALYLVGRIHVGRGELTEARDALLSSLGVDPEQADAHYRLALVFGRLGDLDAAAIHQLRFQELSRSVKAMEEHERQLALLNEAARLASTPAELATVRGTATRLAENVPGDAAVLVVLARVALAQADIATAVATAERVLRIYPDQWEALYILGVGRQQSGRLEAARTALAQSREINAMHAPTHNALGNLLMSVGDPRAAAAAYGDAIRLDVGNPALYLNLAAAYGRLGEAQLEAEAMFEYRRLSQ